MSLLERFNKMTELATRDIARRSSRRGFIGLLGATLAGTASLPLLPVARASAGAPGSEVPPQSTGNPGDLLWR